MANEQSGCPLRRWRPFYGAFGAIDGAIEAAGHPRAAFRDVRVGILKLLRAAATDDDDDDGVAEQLCAALDDAMAESLQTLRLAPVPHAALASTDLARTVADLRDRHGSARIRTLAGDVVRGWTAANVAATTTVEEALHKLPADDRISRQGISKAVKKPIVARSEKKMEAKKPAVAQSKQMAAKKLIAAQSEKMETKKPIVAQSEKLEANKKLIAAQSEKMKLIAAQSEKTEATKRKLYEGCQEAKKLKRQPKIQKIEDKEAPELLEQSQRKMQRDPARCRTSPSGVRGSLLPSLQLI